MTRRNVLVVGNGAREHALAWKLRQSSRVDRLFCAPGNGGTSAIAENVPVAANQIDSLVEWSDRNDIGLVVVGPEEPLALGLVDRLTERGVLAFGPTAAAARIESSKKWAKSLMFEARVPTAAYATFDAAAAAWDYARGQPYPLVLKVDGLAAGKGVVIATTPDEAKAAIEAALEAQAFGEAGRVLVIEEFMVGEELSLLAFVDGRTVVPLVPARDHKRVGDDDAGPNTGGMGAIAPSHVADQFGVDRLAAMILEPIANALVDRGIPYRGVLYAGLMLTAAGPKVVEFNCRLGDPETQVLLPLLNEDLRDLVEATATGQLSPGPLRMKTGYCCGVVVVSEGYPGPYPTGLPISGLERVDADVLVFHAGTKLVNGAILTDGGRVLTVVGQGDTLEAARRRAYANAERVHFAGAHYRRDIGRREVR